MTQRQSLKKQGVFIACVFALFSSFLIKALFAQESKHVVSYPQPVSTYVNDFALLLDMPDRIKIRDVLEELKRKKRIQCTVVTIHSIKDYGATEISFEKFTTDLFNNWGIGSRAKNDGILFLVAVKDRKMRIELGAGYAKKCDKIIVKIIEEKILPHFKNSEYAKGIYEGVNAVTQAADELERLSFENTFFQVFGLFFWGFIFLIWCSFRSGGGRSRSYGRGGRSSGGSGGGRSSGGGGGGGW